MPHTNPLEDLLNNSILVTLAINLESKRLQSLWIGFRRCKYAFNFGASKVSAAPLQSAEQIKVEISCLRIHDVPISLSSYAQRISQGDIALA